MIIDVHVHLTPPEIIRDRETFLKGEGPWAKLYADPKAKMADTSELLAMMDAEGVDKALVMGFPWSNEDKAKRHNEWLLNEAEKHRGRLYPLAAFDPLAPWSRLHAEKMLAAGMFGLGELALYDRGFGHRELDILDFLGRLCAGKVFLMHVNEPMGHQYPGKAPLEIGHIDALVRRCQGVKLLLAHFGGGLPFFAALKKEAAEFLDDVRFDLAAMPFLYKPQAIRMALELLEPARFFLGTDFPLLSPSRYRKYLLEAGLSEDAIGQIMGGAAAEWLGL